MHARLFYVLVWRNCVPINDIIEINEAPELQTRSNDKSARIMPSIAAKILRQRESVYCS